MLQYVPCCLDNVCTSKRVVEIGDAYIELVENYPCFNLEELRRREGEFQRSIDCVNICIAGRSMSEWREDNKETISARQKRYQEKNKKTLLINRKVYCQNNREFLQACAKHYRENNKETVRARTMQWRENNKEVMSAQNKRWRENHKEIRTCLCGNIYNYSRKNRHYDTKKHRAHVALIYAKLNGTSSTM